MCVYMLLIGNGVAAGTEWCVSVFVMCARGLEVLYGCRRGRDTEPAVVARTRCLHHHAVLRRAGGCRDVLAGLGF